MNIDAVDCHLCYLASANTVSVFKKSQNPTPAISAKASDLLYAHSRQLNDYIHTVCVIVHSPLLPSPPLSSPLLRSPSPPPLLSSPLLPSPLLPFPPTCPPPQDKPDPYSDSSKPSGTTTEWCTASTYVHTYVSVCLRTCIVPMCTCVHCECVHMQC